MDIAAASPALRDKNRIERSITALASFARTKPLGTFAATLIVLIVLMAIFAPLISPYDPVAQRSVDRLAPPGATHLLGADNLGRDLLSRIIWGSRISLWVGLVAVVLGTLTGTALGLVSGFWGGRVDLIIQRVVDSIMAFPALVLAMSIVAVLGTDITNVMLAIAVVIIPGASRIVRGAVLAVRENQYVEAARCLGCRDLRIVLRHVLPNVMAPIIVIVTIQLGNAILAEASLSFLGLGTQPPTPSWGQMLSGSAQRFMLMAPWMVIFPGLAITLAVLGFNLLGDALRDVLDPRLRGGGNKGF